MADKLNRTVLQNNASATNKVAHSELCVNGLSGKACCKRKAIKNELIVRHRGNLMVDVFETSTHVAQIYTDGTFPQSCHLLNLLQIQMLQMRSYAALFPRRRPFATTFSPRIQLFSRPFTTTFFIHLFVHYYTVSKMSKNTSSASLATLGDSRLLLVSNRLPVAIKRTAPSTFAFTPGSGGLISGLSGLSKSTEFVWYGWPALELDGEEEKVALREQLAEDCGAVPVYLDGEVGEKYYNGFSSELRTYF